MNELKQLESILMDMDSKQFSSIYYIVGSEEYFKEKIIKKAESILINKSSKDFNLDIFFGAEATDSQVLNACYSLPMLSEHRLVIVHDFEQLSFNDSETFAKYAASPVKETILILIAKKDDKRKKVFSEIHKHAFVFKADSPKNEQTIITWLKSQIKSKNIEIEEEALHLFYDHVGNQLFYLENQLSKLELFAGNEKKIAVKDIEDMIGISKEYSVFELIRNILFRNRKKAFETLNILIEQGEDAIAMIAAMYYRFQKQLLYFQASKEHQSDKEIADKSGIRPFMVKEYRSVSQNYSQRKIEEAIIHLYESDKMLKTSSSRQKDILVTAIQKIMH